MNTQAVLVDLAKQQALEREIVNLFSRHGAGGRYLEHERWDERDGYEYEGRN